jgi:hypothetical protein
MHRVRLLKYHGVKPYVVFDGGHLPAKSGTEDERAQYVQLFFSIEAFPASYFDEITTVSGSQTLIFGLSRFPSLPHLDDEKRISRKPKLSRIKVGSAMRETSTPSVSTSRPRWLSSSSRSVSFFPLFAP